MARFSIFHIVSFVLNGYCYSSTLDCIPSRTASYPFKNHAMSQPHNNPPLHVQKRRNFLCKNRLKIGCSNYIKISWKSLVFSMHTSGYLSKVTPKRAVNMAQFRTFSDFATPPGQSSQFTQPLLFSESVWSEIACKNIPHTHSVFFC